MPKILRSRSGIGKVAPLKVCDGIKNPIRVREIKTKVVLFTLMLVRPHTCRGTTVLTRKDIATFFLDTGVCFLYFCILHGDWLNLTYAWKNKLFRACQKFQRIADRHEQYKIIENVSCTSKGVSVSSLGFGM